MSVHHHRFLKLIGVELKRLFRFLTMPFSKHLFENFSGVPMKIDEMSDLVSNDKPKYDDDVMECLHFGICSSRPALPREIPYFHF